MDELKYAQYIKKANAAEEVYWSLRELYGKDRPWKQVYMMAIRDKVLSEDEKNLLREFFPK